ERHAEGRFKQNLHTTERAVALQDGVSQFRDEPVDGRRVGVLQLLVHARGSWRGANLSVLHRRLGRAVSAPSTRGGGGPALATVQDAPRLVRDANRCSTILGQ